MATELFRKKLIQTYSEVREPDLFLASMFEVRPGNMTDAEKVAIDVEREDEEISPIVNVGEGPTWNSYDQNVTKEWTPPAINEAIPFNATDLLKRNPGQTEYDAADQGMLSALVTRLIRGMQAIERKIRRNREWQASQILQTGILTLKDENGNDVYTIDFLPKASHFTTVGTSWSAGGATPLADIEAMADQIRDDSLQDADMLIMGKDAFNNFVANSTVQQHYDNRRMDQGTLNPQMRGQGAKYQGNVSIGNYMFEIWTYNGRGIIPGAGSKTKFIADDACIVRASSGRLDTLFGGVPEPVAVDARFRDLLPSRVSVPRAVDIAPNIWASPNGKQLNLELESRPLLVPTAIDSFGRIDTEI